MGLAEPALNSGVVLISSFLHSGILLNINFLRGRYHTFYNFYQFSNGDNWFPVCFPSLFRKWVYSKRERFFAFSSRSIFRREAKTIWKSCHLLLNYYFIFELIHFQEEGKTNQFDRVVYLESYRLPLINYFIFESIYFQKEGKNNLTELSFLNFVLKDCSINYLKSSWNAKGVRTLGTTSFD